MDKKLARIYKENSRYVYNVALGMTRNPEEAKDITQDVFIKLFESINSFRNEADIKTYLYRMTVNKTIDMMRRKKTAEKSMEKVHHTPEKPGDTGFILWGLLEKLDMSLRAPVLLAEFGGFSYQEISDILNINIGTVKSRINRAINKMKDIAEGKK